MSSSSTERPSDDAPRPRRFLSVDPERNPAGDPVQACKSEADRLVKAGDLPKYRQVQIERAPLQIKAADWEFTYDGARGVRLKEIRG